MAKIFRTEKLSLNGNIQLSASGSDEFELLNSTGSTLMSKAGIESDISSLHAQRNVDEGTTDSDVSSLAGDIATNKGDLESDVSSLQAQREVDEGTTDSDVSSLAGDIATNKGDLESDVSSLQAQREVDEGTTDSDVSSLAGDIATNKGDLESDVSSLAGLAEGNTGDLESDISSLAGLIATNDVVAVSATLASGVDTSGSISFERTFASTPIVVAQLKSSNADDPIIACMVSAISTTSATVAFADQTPNANYTVELIASIG
jgi:hypothetical protein